MFISHKFNDDQTMQESMSIESKCLLLKKANGFQKLSNMFFWTKKIVLSSIQVYYPIANQYIL